MLISVFIFFEMRLHEFSTLSAIKFINQMAVEGVIANSLSQYYIGIDLMSLEAKILC